jgi:hypothetical protein
MCCKSGAMGMRLNIFTLLPPVLPTGTTPTAEPKMPSTMRTTCPKAAIGCLRRNSTLNQPVRFGVGQDKGLANDVRALNMGKARLKFTSCDELLRQSNLIVEGQTLNGIHESLSMAI